MRRYQQLSSTIRGVSGITGHERQDSRDIEQVADAPARMRNRQNAPRCVGRLEGADQFTHASGVDVVEVPQVEQDPPFATEKEGVDALAEPGVERHAKGARNFKDRLVGAVFECGRIILLDRISL